MANSIRRVALIADIDWDESIQRHLWVLRTDERLESGWRGRFYPVPHVEYSKDTAEFLMAMTRAARVQNVINCMIERGGAVSVVADADFTEILVDAET